MTNEQLINELQRELEKYRHELVIMPSNHSVGRLYTSSVSLESNNSSEPFKLEELHHEIDVLRKHNKTLEENNQELEAMLLTRDIEEGRNLIYGSRSTANLADELKEMDQTQEALHSLSQVEVKH